MLAGAKDVTLGFFSYVAEFANWRWSGFGVDAMGGAVTTEVADSDFLSRDLLLWVELFVGG
jgi:hypothetical protein